MLAPGTGWAGDDWPLFQSDFGGVGLMQTPSARMAPLGTASVHYGRIDPYEHYTFSFQPFEWMEAGFRYTQIRNRVFGVAEDTVALDKGVDAKFRLVNESTYLPTVALGFRDFGGTGLFGGEYLVANKRWHDFDFSLGIGWGYLGEADNPGNPLGSLSERFDSRPRSGGDGGGDFNLEELFRGPASLFAGVQYRTPLPGLVVQAELDGNDYDNEPLNNRFEQDSPVNVGLRYQLNDVLSFSAGWQRGNTAMFGMTFSVGLADVSQTKSDPPEAGIGPAPERTTNDWGRVSNVLNTNAGIRVARIIREDDTLFVEGEPTKYRAMPQAEQRANRILHNVTAPEIDEFRYRWLFGGFYLREDVLPRDPLPDTPYIETSKSSEFDEQDYRYDVYAQDVPPDEIDRPEGEILYERPQRGFNYGLEPGLNQNFGGPDGYLYQAYARFTMNYRTDANGWLSGVVAVPIFDNLDKFDFLAPSQLPRVRTFIVNYLEATEVGIYNLQYTRTARLGGDWFGMAYAGLLEMMYAGGGGEVLYRPFNSPIALGLDVNWVRQREFEQRFGLRDYSTVTGHATAYVDTGIKDVLAKVSVGRYLARDVGATFDFSRRFESGVRLGAYATFTSAGDKFGEGSFDKGIYITIPYDAFFTNSSRQEGTLVWSPLTRDGGARLHRRFGLYGLTEERDMGTYWSDFAN